MTNHYLVHWDDYQTNLQASFERQFLSESFVDVTLAVDSGLIKCHRVVLCAASAYFQQLLSQHNCSHPIIFMRDMQYWEVIALVDFMYRGEVSIEEEKLEPLMQAAQTLQMHGLSACLRACLLNSCLYYSQVIALVDFMYRGEVSIEEEKLEPLMRAAQTLQIHGLSACLKACLQRSGKIEDNQEEQEDSQESTESVGGDRDTPPGCLEPQVQLSTLSKLCEFNRELELRPITPTHSTRPSPSLSLPISQKKVVKEEIEFMEEKSEQSTTDFEPSIQIQSVFSERPHTAKGEHSDDYNDIEEEPPERSHGPPSERTFRQFLLVNPRQEATSRPQPEYHKLSLNDPPMYKRYSPGCLEQALRDLQTGHFRSIRACARHHGIPMTTLRYRAKGLTKRPSWMQ